VAEVIAKKIHDQIFWRNISNIYGYV